MAITVHFEPIGRSGAWLPQETLLQCGHRLGVGIATACGGRGRCRSCRVRVTDGTVAEGSSLEEKIFSPRELAEGWRRACQTYPTSDCRLVVPPRSMLSPQRTQVEGEETAVPLEPLVRAYPVEVPPATLRDFRADASRLLATLAERHSVRAARVHLALLRELSPRLERLEGRAQAVVRGEEVIALLPLHAGPLGLAVDLGTTKLAAYLVDLRDGRTLAARGEMNPQISHGDDLVTRISHALSSAAAARELQELVVQTLGRMARDLCREAGTEPAEIVDAVIVGNTAMHHLLLRLPVAQLARAPYVAAVSDPLDLSAGELGFAFAPGTQVHLLPNIAGFVGGDHTAVLLAVSAHEARGTQLFLDIGTNTEVSLVCDGAIGSVSCASGPAFEGGHITDGMRAAPGAIERFWLIEGSPQYETIDGAPPIGLCGSGILDTVAQLYLGGVLDRAGRMGSDHPCVRPREQSREFVLVPEEERGQGPAIVLTQRDVRELQLAKAAIRTGIDALLAHAGRAEEEVEQVVIAGAFGSHIDIASAITVGMLPDLPLERFRQVGNAAGMGAKQALVSRARRSEAVRIAARAQYLELAAEPRFTESFTANLAFHSPQGSDG